MSKKIVSSHQPHFFPWLGYFDKMAKADLFLINDVCQLEKQSPMLRNKILDRMGREQFINVIVDKKDVIQKENRQILLKNWDECRESIKGKIRDCYKNAKFFEEIWPKFCQVLDRQYTYLLDIELETIKFGRDCLDIQTPMMFQSAFSFEEGRTTSERLASKLKAVDACYYLSGNGAKKYMNDSDFTDRGIIVVYQLFKYPIYPQVYGGGFVPNLSVIDLLFNCGISVARALFWENVKQSKEFENV